jgi:hypothetical protein
MFRRVFQGPLGSVVILLVVMGGSAVAQNDPTADCSPSIVTTEGQFVLIGDTKMMTRPFDLGPGSYTIRWSGTMNPLYSGNLIMYLRRADGTGEATGLVSVFLNADRPTMRGETHLYNVKPGAHYLDVIAPGDWSLSISPL